MVGGTVLSKLEQRIADGERYLEATPNPDKRAADLYWRLTAEYVCLKEAEERESDIKAIVLDLPPHCRWQRAGSDTIHSTVRVVYPSAEGPVDVADITKDELKGLLNIAKTVKGEA